MKLFRNGSVAMVSECQKIFSILHLKYQVNIRTASFMLRFMSTENSICHLFVSQESLTLDNIYIWYVVSVDSTHSLTLDNIYIWYVVSVDSTHSLVSIHNLFKLVLLLCLAICDEYYMNINYTAYTFPHLHSSLYWVSRKMDFVARNKIMMTMLHNTTYYMNKYHKWNTQNIHMT